MFCIEQTVIYKYALYLRAMEYNTIEATDK